MDRHTRKYIEKLLYDYPYMEGYIAKHKREIMTPYRETDTNLGGGKSGRVGADTADRALALATDKRISKLEEMRAAMDKVIGKLDPSDRRILELRYWSSTEQAWPIIAMQVEYSERQCYNIRDGICERVAREMGLID